MAPRDSHSVALYAAAGTVAAIAVAYVAGPSFFSTGEEHARSSGTVGLSNPGNDCFINSVLQAFAGLPELEASLAQLVTESLSNEVDGEVVFSDDGLRSTALADCAVSRALRGLLQMLNESAPSRRTATARPVLRSLEHVFRTRISRQQQDAHEFLQIIADRLRDEHHAFVKHYASPLSRAEPAVPDPRAEDRNLQEDGVVDTMSRETSTGRNRWFALEGATESIIQCQVCNYKPNPTAASFVVLTLNVPQQSSATVDECLDGFFKVETIEDYKCQSCCLQHKLRLTERQFQSCKSSADQTRKAIEISRLRHALEEDPEQEIVEASAGQQLPRSRISKHNTIAAYPAVLALHFSRSIFDTVGTSRKNYAALEFPEHLRLGGFEAKNYRLMSVITHKGGHHSGHYVTFRRQQLPQYRPPAQTSKSEDNAGTATDQAETTAHSSDGNRNKKAKAKWWRISDDHVSECSTKDVLSMQRDAYILFYELDKKP